MLPNFGPYAQQKMSKVHEIISSEDHGVVTPVTGLTVEEMRPAPKPSRDPMRINDVIACGTDRIGAWHELSQEEHVIAEIDPSMCVNCGACYTSCNDAGYQVSFYIAADAAANAAVPIPSLLHMHMLTHDFVPHYAFVHAEHHVRSRDACDRGGC